MEVFVEHMWKGRGFGRSGPNRGSGVFQRTVFISKEKLEIQEGEREKF